MATSTLPFSPAAASTSFLLRTAGTSPLVVKSASFPSPLGSNCRRRRRAVLRTISCRVASASASVDKEKDASVSGSGEAEEQVEQVNAKIGARVRVKVPLKVYHVPRVPEIDLTGLEGVMKQYVGLWKGKRISANLPYKVEFVKEIEGRGPVKFFTHLKKDEFEYVD
ncbi:hypothetical protein SLA2020_023130 [Shorea laevis]